MDAITWGPARDAEAAYRHERVRHSYRRAARTDARRVVPLATRTTPTAPAPGRETDPSPRPGAPAGVLVPLLAPAGRPTAVPGSEAWPAA